MTTAAMTTTQPPKVDLATLEPVIRAHAATSEANRKMAPEVIDALVGSGVLRMWVPQALGGPEMGAAEALAVMESIARIDGSVGWVVSNCVFITTMCQFLAPEVYEPMLRDPGVVACGSFVPPGSAVETSGGYLVSGNWTFGSASHYATSLVVLTLLTDHNGMVLGEDGAPISAVAYLDPAQVTFLDTWHTLGLKGTGSTNFTADNLFVPKDHVYLLSAWENTTGPFSGPLYRLGLMTDAIRIAAVAVGIAQGALDEFIALATEKTPAYTASLTADRATVQERVARAEALIQAGRYSLAGSIADSLRAIEGGGRITGPATIPMGLAAAFALDHAAKAVDLLHEAAGTTAFRDESPLQKRFRDIQTLRQNAITSWSRYESLGKMILGRPSDWPFHQL